MVVYIGNDVCFSTHEGNQKRNTHIHILLLIMSFVYGTAALTMSVKSSCHFYLFFAFSY